MTNERLMLEALLERDQRNYSAWELDFIEHIETKLDSATPLSEKESEKLKEIYDKQ